MPLHSILIVNANNDHVLYSRHFYRGGSSSEENYKALSFQQELFQHTGNTKTQNRKHTVTLNDIHVIYERYNDLVVFVSGYHECDEIILCEILESLYKLLNEVLDGSVNEASFLTTETYGKWLLVMSEFTSEDILEWTDVDMNIKMTKLK